MEMFMVVDGGDVETPDGGSLQGQARGAYLLNPSPAHINGNLIPVAAVHGGTHANATGNMLAEGRSHSPTLKHHWFSLIIAHSEYYFFGQKNTTALHFHSMRGALRTAQSTGKHLPS